MNYQLYLRSEHWRLLRGAKLQISPRCEKCRSKQDLEVHHTVYQTSWFLTKICDLQTLCHDCHMLEHAKAWEVSGWVPPIHVHVIHKEPERICAVLRPAKETRGDKRERLRAERFARLKQQRDSL